MKLYHHLIVNCTRACHTISQSFVTLRVNKCNYICVTAGGTNKTNHVWFCVEDEGGDPRGAGGVSDTDRRLGKSLSDVTAGIATAGALTPARARKHRRIYRRTRRRVPGGRVRPGPGERPGPRTEEVGPTPICQGG